MALFEVEGIDEFADALDMVSKNYPKEVRKFMMSEGTKLKNRTVKLAKATVKQHTGNLFKGIKRGKYYKYSGNGADSIRVYAGKPAYHGHLVEYGHVQTKISSKTLNGRNFCLKVTKSGKSAGRVEGYYIFKTAADAFESTYDSDCEKFADKITEPLNR